MKTFILSFFLVFLIQSPPGGASETSAGFKQLGSHFISPSGAKGGHDGGVGISGDGQFIAFGSPNAGLEFQGEVKVHKFNRQESSWEQVGQTLKGESAEEYMGVDVSLSYDGRRLAIGSLGNDKNVGSVRLYLFNRSDKQWELFDKRNGSQPHDGFGRNVVLSSRGTVLAVGTKSYVQVFNCFKNAGSCAKRGGSFNNTGLRRVALSSDGDKSIVGSPDYASSAGKLALHYFNEEGQQYKLLNFNPSISSAQNDRLGYDVSMSGDGNSVAFSSVRESCTSSTGMKHSLCGVVRVFSTNGIQIGNDIKGESSFYLLGLNVDLSEDGKTIIIASSNYDASSTVTIYNFDSGSQDWQKVDTIQGEKFSPKANAIDIGINASGRRVVFLSPQNSKENLIRVFEKFEESSESVANKNVSNQSQGPVCENEGGYKFKNVNGKKKNCFYITKKARHRQMYCTGEIAVKCQKACGIC